MRFNFEQAANMCYAQEVVAVLLWLPIVYSTLCSASSSKYMYYYVVYPHGRYCLLEFSNKPSALFRSVYVLQLTLIMLYMRGFRGGHEVRTPSPLKNLKNIGFLSSWSGSPEKLQSYQASIQCSAIIGTPEKRHLKMRFAGVQMMARL